MDTDPLVYFYPAGHAAHASPGHPEHPGRIEAIVAALQAAGWWEVYPKLPPLELPLDVLHAIHSPAYLNLLEMACRRGAGRLDHDTYVQVASWQLALNAAGGAAAVAQVVWRGKALRGFALCRPPGHHALRGQGMGFCLLNNIAIAAEALLRQGVQKLAIVDLDLHHGNGTQDIFWRRGEVFFASVHQMPLYPGSGNLWETGEGPGKGTTANFPLPPWSGDAAYLAVMDELILPLLGRFAPQMILVSYGFDAHWRDPLGNLLLSAGAYGQLIARLAHWADEFCGGRIALILEGGYDLEAAAACSQAVVAALLGQPYTDPLGTSPDADDQGWRSRIVEAKKMWGLA